jgi:hypothetical protein
MLLKLALGDRKKSTGKKEVRKVLRVRNHQA